MNTSKEGIAFIQSYEKCSLKAYMPTPNDRPTIGYGCTFYEDGTSVKMGEEITQERADSLFTALLKSPERVASRLNLPNQCMFDSIVSLVFNIGEANFNSSTLRKVILASPTNYLAIEAEFKRWIYQAHKVLPGLVKRREKEAKMFIEGVYENN